MSHSPTFSFDWFTPIIPQIEPWLKPLAGTQIRALEIGSFEGRSTCWFMDNILTHERSQLTCIDHFLGGSDHKDVDLKLLHSRFAANTAVYGDRIAVYPLDSWLALKMLESDYFHFAFIDGSHEKWDVLHDAVECYRVVRPDGLIIFDDYGWGMDRESRPGVAIDAFLQVFNPKVTVLYKHYAVVCQKNDNASCSS